MQNDAWNNEMQALVSLLDDPDSNIFTQVSAKIHGFGAQAIPFLQTAWENDASTRWCKAALKKFCISSILKM